MKVSIVPAGGNPQNPLFPGVFDPMIPINGKPTIDYIISQNKNRGAEKIIILLHPFDQPSFDYIQFREDPSVVIIRIEADHSLGQSISQVKSFCSEGDQLIINLGDTLYNGSIDTNNKLLISTKKVLDTTKWCFVNAYGEFINKPEQLPKSYHVVSGIYSLSHGNDFFKYLEIAGNDFYGGLDLYNKKHHFSYIEETGNWYDLGHIDEYYKSKIDFLRVRSFNSLIYDDFRGVITKKSTNQQKIKQEINRFLNLPNDLKNFTPRIVDYSLEGDKTFYSLEFYGYNTLADSFIFGNYPINYRTQIVDKLMQLLLYIKENYHIKIFPRQHGYDIYYKKTLERISMLRKNPILDELWLAKKYTINGEIIDNPFPSILNLLEKFVERINTGSDNCIIHGDLCFSNILFDNNNGLIKLIDPRGNFGEISIYGDIKYDIAKLRHSIHGRYEYIVSDLFHLEYNLKNTTFRYKYFRENNEALTNYFDLKIEELGIDKNIIIFIEGLLFLTMIPLHSDSLNRQIMMYLTSVKIFNSYIQKNLSANN